MEINFETVRIGKFRKNVLNEKILKENYLILKNELRTFLKTIPSELTIDVDIVIPAKGSCITITLDAIKDQEIRNQLIEYFPNSIYRGKYSELENNIQNKDFFPLGI